MSGYHLLGLEAHERTIQKLDLEHGRGHEHHNSRPRNGIPQCGKELCRHERRERLGGHDGVSAKEGTNANVDADVLAAPGIARRKEGKGDNDGDVYGRVNNKQRGSYRSP